MKQEELKLPPASVTGATQTKQAGGNHDRWPWLKTGVWTERMLTRLEASEPTTVWFALWDKVWAPKNLQTAFWAVWRNKGAPGVDRQSVEQFDEHASAELARLSEELRSKRYRCLPAKRKWIPKPGTTELRPLGIPAVRDRTVQASMRHVLEPIFEKDFAESSHGFRPGRGCAEAVARIEELLSQGYTICVDADLKGYFDSIPQDRLMELIRQRVKDGNVLNLLEQFLKAGVMEEMKGWQPTEQGTPQGAVISPLLSNIYLNPLDHEMARRGWKIVRYADDFVVLCQTQEEAENVLNWLKEWTAQAGLTLHPTKTKLVDARTQGFDFLGWHFRNGKKWPRKKNVLKLREKLRPLTKRNNGRCMAAIVAKVNPILRGWRNYFREATPTSLSDVDGWLRRRLRAMLLKRKKTPGFGKSKADQKRWPIQWFAERGLYSLKYGSCSYR